MRLLCSTLTLFAASQVAAQATDPLRQTWTPQRVYQAQDGQLTDLEGLAAAASHADVLFFGEQHDDGPTHRMELALLEAIARRRKDVVVSLEMFERDMQSELDRYLAGKITEAEFLAIARPWPNYATDYRPLVEFAKSHGWRVIAANIPRPMASAIAAKGMEAVTGLTDSTRGWAATAFQCPKGRYFDHFVEEMGGHGSPTADAGAKNERYFASQCMKDETMAEAIVRARAASGGKALVIHYNGAFHSDYGDGTAERVRRRIPGASVKVISAMPQADLDVPPTQADRDKGDWILFTLQPKSTKP